MTPPALYLKPGRERAVRNRHPWVFSGAVASAPGAAEGDVVAVYTADKQLVGYGHYAGQSQITCRIFFFTDEPLVIDDAFWLEQFRVAHAYRQRMLDLALHTGYRLINAEGDYLPGCTVDVYADTAVLQLRTAGMQRLQTLLVHYLTQELGLQHILIKTENEGEGAGSTWLLGGKPEIHFQEAGLQFVIDAARGQKTGFFLDQRDARALVSLYAQGRRVLNAFSYTGAFGLYALRGGAVQVTNVDSSQHASELARATATLNGYNEQQIICTTADCFDYLKQVPEAAFDLIVLDPPAFTKHISTIDRAARGYKDINMRAMAKAAPGSLLFTFSCSQHMSRELFRKVVFGAAADAGRAVRVLHHTGHAADHPTDIYHPEGEYLKGLVLYID